MSEQNFYIGVVESRDDPLQLGRVKVRVMGLHTEDKSVLPTDDLPWAYKVQPTTSGGVSGIGHAPVGVLEGTWVTVQYIDPEKQMPFIVGTLGGFPQKVELDIENDLVDSGGSALTNDFDPVAPATPPAPLEENRRTVSSEASAQEDVIANVVDISQLVKTYGPNARVVGKALEAAGITNPYAIIAILGNVGKECKFQPVREDVYYTTLARIRSVFPSKTKNLTDEQLAPYVKNSPALASLVYAGVGGNGDEASTEGNKYRGGGYIQITGKNNYRVVGDAIGVDLVEQPALVTKPDVAAKACAAYFISRYGKAPSFSSYDEALRDVTKKVNPGGFSRDFPNVQKVAALCFVISEPKPLEPAPAPETTTGTTSGSGNTVSTGGNATTDPSNLGFSDPNKVYPKQDHLKEPDTNRLARHSKISKTVVYKKETVRHQGVQKANNKGTWDQPLVPYNSVYPYNNVWESESGHLLEFDDTKGRERVHLYHTKGTFTEIDHNGTQVNYIVGDGFTIYERNGYAHVTGNLNVTVGGAKSLLVEGAMEIEVRGSATINLHNTASINVAKDLNITAGGAINMKAVGGIALDGAKIDLNSGVASGLPTIPCKKESQVNLADLKVDARGDNAAIEYELNEDASADQIEAYQKKVVSEGIATQEEVTAQPEVKEEVKPAENNAPEVQAECGIPAGQVNFTGNEVLSKYFKLSDLTMGYSRKLVKMGNVTPAEIFCNLKALALNVLDPLKSRYPNMKINSGFRNSVPPGGSNTSLHMTGQAVDISFPDVSREELYNVILEVQKIVPYDQLILEYASGPGWIHISYRTSGNRKQHFTMNHHKRVSKDLQTIVRVY